jgi:hypothetical protein
LADSFLAGRIHKLRGRLQEFWRAAYIPIRVGWPQMPEVDGQVRQPFLDITSLAMPSREAVHREGVSEGMERRCALSRGCLDSGMVEQSPKGDACAGVLQAPTNGSREERCGGSIA